MDMQGTPTGSSSSGMKNTSDPASYENPTTEGAGAPAPDAAEREAKAAWQETADEAKGPGGQRYTEGNDTTSGPTGSGDSKADVDAAPGYVSSVVSDPAQTGKPKGKNITEGGFDEGDDKNTSFTSDIGDKNDPGRRAENEMQRMTQSSSGSTAPRQKMGDSDSSQYDVLDTDQNL